MNWFLCLNIFIISASAFAEVVNLNAMIDRALESANAGIKESGRDSYPLKQLPFNENITINNAMALGLNSLIRTGDCTVTSNDNKTTDSFDIHLGFNFLTVFFDYLTIYEDDMLAFLRIKDISLRASFTKLQGDDERDCRVSLDSLNLERLDKAEFGASDPKYDGVDVSTYLQTSVRSSINDSIKKLYPLVEAYLQEVCNEEGMKYQFPESFAQLLTNFAMNKALYYM